MSKIKLAFSTNAFKRHSLDDAVRKIAQVGYEGVEILCDAPHAYPPTFGDSQVEAAKDTITSLGMQISNLNAFTLFAIGDTYHPSWIDRDDSRRRIRIHHTIDCLRLARKLGARTISTEPGGPKTERPRTEMLELFAAGLREAALVAEAEGIELLVEPEPGLLIEKSSEFKDFMKTVDSEFLKLNFDIGHFYCVSEDPAALVKELAPYIGHFHLADIASSRIHNHLIPGRGAIDFSPVFDAVRSIGYRGFVTVELYPYQDNPVLAATEAYNYLKRIA